MAKKNSLAETDTSSPRCFDIKIVSAFGDINCRVAASSPDEARKIVLSWFDAGMQVTENANGRPELANSV